MLDSHLEQLLPALLTTVIGSRLSSSSAEDHWSLRSLAADVVASTCSKYRVSFPDLHSQVCQTYTGQLKSPGGASSTTLPVVYSSLYGCIVGLTALGHTVTKTLLLTELAALEHKLFAVSPGFLFNSSNSSNKSNGNGGAEAYLERKRCLAALTIAVGKYIISSLRLYQSLPSSNRYIISDWYATLTWFQGVSLGGMERIEKLRGI